MSERSEVPVTSHRRLTSAMRAARTTGEVFVTSGVVILLFVVWLLWWTDVIQARTQQSLRSDLRNEWASPHYSIDRQPIGAGIAVLRIPRFGTGYREVIVKGAGEDDLQKGPGHLLQTQDPGAEGNFAVSGHRTTYGHPFRQLDTLRKGDVVVVQTKDQWLTYKVDALTVVLPTAVEVLRPIPGRSPFHTPGKYITFTTCTPKYSASHRLVMFGDLIRVDDASDQAFVPRSLRPGVITVDDMNKQV